MKTGIVQGCIALGVILCYSCMRISREQYWCCTYSGFCIIEQPPASIGQTVEGVCPALGLGPTLPAAVAPGKLGSMLLLGGSEGRSKGITGVTTWLIGVIGVRTKPLTPKKA